MPTYTHAHTRAHAMAHITVSKKLKDFVTFLNRPTHHGNTNLDIFKKGVKLRVLCNHNLVYNFHKIQKMYSLIKKSKYWDWVGYMLEMVKLINGDKNNI